MRKASTPSRLLPPSGSQSAQKSIRRRESPSFVGPDASGVGSERKPVRTYGGALGSAMRVPSVVAHTAPNVHTSLQEEVLADPYGSSISPPDSVMTTMSVLTDPMSHSSAHSSAPFPTLSCLHYSSTTGMGGVESGIFQNDTHPHQTHTLQTHLDPEHGDRKDVVRGHEDAKEDGETEATSIPDAIQRVTESVYKSEQVRTSAYKYAYTHSASNSSPQDHATIALNVTSALPPSNLPIKESLIDSTIVADSMIISDSMMAVANQTTADSFENSPAPRVSTPINYNSITSPIFMSYQKEQHASDSEDDIAELGLDELLKAIDAGRPSPRNDGAVEPSTKLFTSVFDESVMKSGRSNRSKSAGPSGSHRRRTGSRENSRIQDVSKGSISSRKRSNSAGRSSTRRRAGDKERGREESAMKMKGGAVRVSRYEEGSRRAYDGHSPSSTHDDHANASNASIDATFANRTDMAVKLDRSIDDLESIESQLREQVDSSVMDVQSGDVQNDDVQAISYCDAQSVYSSINDTTTANTTMTLDHSYLLNNNGMFSFDADMSVYQKRKNPATIRSDKESTEVPRMAIKSVKRAKDSLPEVKEILFLTVPGQFTTMNLRFSNQQSKSLTMKAQTVQIRFEGVNQFQLVDSTSDIGNYNAFEVASPTNTVVPKGKEVCWRA